MLAPIMPPLGYRAIVVDDLRLRIFIGVLEEERLARQEVAVSLYMLVRDAGPSRSDALADHVSYADVVAKLRERGQSSRHTNLVETLAEECAEFALADPRVESVIVDVRKPEIIAEASGVGVIIHRRRRPGEA
jgi:FolB domain-containing protein